MNFRESCFQKFANRMKWLYLSKDNKRYAMLKTPDTIWVPPPDAPRIDHMAFVADIWDAIGGGALLVHYYKAEPGFPEIWKVQFEAKTAIHDTVSLNGVACDLSLAAVIAASNAMGFNNPFPMMPETLPEALCKKEEVAMEPAPEDWTASDQAMESDIGYQERENEGCRKPAIVLGILCLIAIVFCIFL